MSRPTQLGFRAPDERTAEYNVDLTMNKEGKRYQILEETKVNPKGSNLPQAQRFKVMPFYDRATGQSVFIGPGSYNAHESPNKLGALPCSTVIVSEILKKLKHFFRNL